VHFCALNSKYGNIVVTIEEVVLILSDIDIDMTDVTLTIRIQHTTVEYLTSILYPKGESIAFRYT
jgi:hypothetical protein